MPRQDRRYKSRCKHFNGLNKDQCLAGVTYVDVMDERESTSARFPCFLLDYVPGRCVKVEYERVLVKEET